MNQSTKNHLHSVAMGNLREWARWEKANTLMCRYMWDDWVNEWMEIRTRKGTKLTECKGEEADDVISDVATNLRSNLNFIAQTAPSMHIHPSFPAIYLASETTARKHSTSQWQDKAETDFPLNQISVFYEHHFSDDITENVVVARAKHCRAFRVMLMRQRVCLAHTDSEQIVRRCKKY